MRITDETTFGLEALIDRGTSHNFISFEAWKTLPKGSMVPTNATVRAINGMRTKPIGHVTLDIIIATRVAGTLLSIACRYNGETCGP